MIYPFPPMHFDTNNKRFFRNPPVIPCGVPVLCPLCGDDVSPGSNDFDLCPSCLAILQERD